MKLATYCRLAFSLSLAAAALAACTAGQSPVAPMSAPIAGMAQPAHAKDYLYVANQGGVLNYGSVNVDDASLMHVTRRLVRGAENPYKVAVDATGTLYVLDAWYAVTEFDRGTTKSSRRILDQYAALAMALDGSNNLYIDSCYSCMPQARPLASQRDSILEYRAKSTKLLRTITDGIRAPQSIIVDSAGNLYVANEGNHPSITVYKPGSTKLSRKITLGIKNPSQLAIDPSGNLFVANDYYEIAVYASGSSSPLYTITAGIASPQAMAFDASGTLYVANTANFASKGWVSVYAAGSASEKYEITTGISNPVALAVAPDGTLYVDNNDWQYPRSRGRLTIYEPASQTPLRSVRAGRKYGWPIALAFGPG